MKELRKIFYPGKPYRITCGLVAKYVGKFCYVNCTKDDNLGNSIAVPMENVYGAENYIYITIPSFQFPEGERITTPGIRTFAGDDFIEPLKITEELLLFQRINLKWAFWLEVNKIQLQEMAVRCLLNENDVYEMPQLEKEKIVITPPYEDVALISFLQQENLRYALKVGASYRILEKMADDGVLNKDEVYNLYQSQERTIMN